MARALIKVNGTDTTIATVTIGSSVALANDGNGGETTYAWSVVDQPAGTADVLTGATSASSSFTPTKEGSYRIQLVVNALQPSQSTATAIVAVLDARTGDRYPAATEVGEASSRGWAADLNVALRRALHATADGTTYVAQTPGGIAAGQIVKPTATGTVNSGTQAQFTAPQVSGVNATAAVSGRVGIILDGVTPGDLGANKLVLVRTYGLVPTAGTGSPTVGDPVYLSNAGLPALLPGTAARAIGVVVQSAAGSYQWVIDGTAGGISDGNFGDVTVSGGGSMITVNAAAITNAKLAQAAADTLKGNNTGSPATPIDLTVAQVKTLLAIAAGDVSGLAAIATSGSASDLTGGAVPAARMPAHTGDVTSSAGSVALTIANAAVTNAKMAQGAANTLLGNNTGISATRADLTAAQVKTMLAIAAGDVSGLAAIATSGSASDLSSGTLPAARFPALSSDLTNSAGSTAVSIVAGAVTLAKMANLAANSIIGNNTGSPATPIALTTAQVKTLLAIAASDVSGLAAIATSGSASDLGSGTVPAAAMPALTGDVTTSIGTVATSIANSAVTTAKIAANAVTLAKLATQADQTILGNNSGGAAVPSALTAAQVRTLLGLATVATSGSAADLSGTLAAAQLPALTGDVTSSAGSAATTIASHAVTYAKQAQAAANTFAGNNTGSTADKVDMTVAQARTLLGLAAIATSGSGADLAANSVANTALAQMADQTVKGNVSGSTANASDIALSTLITKLPVGIGFFGDGSDGALSGSRTLTRNLYCTTYTLANGDAVDLAGFTLYCSTSLNGPASGSATIRHNGSNAANNTGGAGAPAGYLGGGTNGASGSGTGGGATIAGGNVPTDFRPGVGGAGGTGTNAGGAGGALTPIAATSGGYNDILTAIKGRLWGSNNLINGGSGGGSGAGGAPGTGTGGGGGGGGGNAVVVARTTTNAANITIQANGGNGGNAVSGTGAPCGGGGGGGGYATQVIGYGSSCTIQSSGGSPGTGAGGGASGSSGNTGRTTTYVLMS